jgi:hypothetical protein
VPGYDCHGLTFACSQFIIDDSDVSKILRSEYDSCARDSADVVIYYLNDSIKHSALRIADTPECFWAKGGVRAVSCVSTPESASSGVPYDGLKFFRLKKE